MKKKILIIFGLLIVFVLSFAGWEAYIHLTDPADGDLLAVQDVSNQSLNPSGRVSYLTLSELWAYFVAKITSDDVTIVDDGENFTATNLTGVLAELLNLIPTEVPTANYGYDFVPIAGLSMKDGTSPPDAAVDRKPYTYRTYSGIATEDQDGWWTVPPDMNPSDTRVWFCVKGLITATTAAEADEGIAFGLKGVGTGDGDPTGYTKGTAGVSTHDNLDMIQWDHFITDWAPVTIPGIEPNATVEFNFYRAYDNVVDDYEQLVGPYVICFRYVRSLEVAEAP